ncbi:hypothetical protein OS493_009161 [Desmophyllum pertusum]|uniref:Uncharacterized protein n=1 Tax=Desmophyllum pertusum TaxID=174260 RepID=A0A9W9Z5P1_9CNID|nr:hypothetical protein OS493_009161 [Desmophyllum pertusum]
MMTLALKGRDGAIGTPGTKGSAGPPGPPGAAGVKGPNGDPGACQPSPFQCSPGVIATLTAKLVALEKTCKSAGGGSSGGGGGSDKPKCGLGRCKDNPATNCQEIYTKDSGAVSGAYWIKGKADPFQTHCEVEPMAARGWTLVARIPGSSNEFSPVSNTWATTSVINDETAPDTNTQNVMKNVGWSDLRSNILRVCYDGPRTHCATFTHNRNMSLAELFNNQFGVTVDEDYKMDTLLKAFGKVVICCASINSGVV